MSNLFPLPPIFEPVSESERLAVLDSYDVLDSAPESGFDDVVMLARQICETPIALVSLVASDRQWFKAVSGLSVCETPLDQSVCAHALRQTETLIIPDLTKDERTRDNPLVTGDPFIRFYAGALLTSRSGIPIGAVCVIDTEPRPEGLTADQQFAIEALGRQVMTMLELRRSVLESEMTASQQRSEVSRSAARAIESERLAAKLRINEERLRMAQEAGRVGSFEIDVSTDRIAVTEQFCLIFGLPMTMNMPAADIEKLVHPDDLNFVSNRASRQKGNASLYSEYRIRRPDNGEIVWVARRAQFIRDALGATTRLLGTIQDITERKGIEQRQKVLNDELSHRLKNTLAMVQAIARQTLRNASDREAVRSFESRVNALSHAHDILLRQSWSAADMQELMTGVLALLGDRQRFVMSGPRVALGPRAALSFSLLMHELATNALKYGALSVQTGTVDLTWAIEGGTLTFTWVERGGPAVAAPIKTGLGSRLIDIGFLGTGKTSKSYNPLGLEVEITAPLASVEDPS